jgi:DMSO/TMAO reductase YedYZ molybdopterin-dependent catalytic subunit
MNTKLLLKGGLIGLWLNIIVAWISWVGALLTGLPFIPFSWFEWLSRILPGPLISRGIETIVSIVRFLNIGPTSDVAKLGEQAMAIVLFLVAGFVAGMAAASFRRLKLLEISLGGFLMAAVLFVISALAIFLTNTAQDVAIGGTAIALWCYLIWSIAFPRLFFSGQRQPVGEEFTSAEMQDRRTFLRWLGAGAAGVIIVLMGFAPGLRKARQVPVTGSGSPTPKPTLQPGAPQTGAPSAAELTSRVKPAPGTRSELTAVEDFYRIDINLTVPHINADLWRLDIKGLIPQPVKLTLDDILARPSVDQTATLSCISNYVGGDLIGTAVWTGIRVRDLLEELNPAPEAKALHITADDGFYESVPFKEAMDERTLLIYAMNGKPLTDEHGFPLRIFIPNHYGMKQPKWIRSIEVVDTALPGFWVDRGWDPLAIVQTTSVIDTVALDSPSNGLIPIGGIAYAGARSIQKVEIQIDDSGWQPAQLILPPLSHLTWVQWRFDWAATPGEHLVHVHAVDGDGSPQIETSADPHPSGATGIHSKRFVIK